VERFKKTIKSKLVSKESKNWDRLLLYLLFAYCEVPQSSTGSLPYEVLYGREVRGPLDVLREEWETSKRSDESILFHILQLRERLEEMSELVNENMKVAQKQACQQPYHHIQDDAIVVSIDNSRMFFNFCINRALLYVMLPSLF